MATLMSKFWISGLPYLGWTPRFRLNFITGSYTICQLKTSRYRNPCWILSNFIALCEDCVARAVANFTKPRTSHFFDLCTFGMVS